MRRLLLAGDLSAREDDERRGCGSGSRCPVGASIRQGQVAATVAKYGRRKSMRRLTLRRTGYTESDMGHRLLDGPSPDLVRSDPPPFGVKRDAVGQEGSGFGPIWVLPCLTAMSVNSASTSSNWIGC